MFYELAANTWGPEEIGAMHRVIASNRFTMGPYVAAFEEAFASTLAKDALIRAGILGR